MDYEKLSAVFVVTFDFKTPESMAAQILGQVVVKRLLACGWPMNGLSLAVSTYKKYGPCIRGLIVLTFISS